MKEEDKEEMEISRIFLYRNFFNRVGRGLS